MAEGLGFEPRRRSHDLPVFKTGPFNHLGNPPYYFGRGGGIRTHSAVGNGFTVRPSSPTLAPPVKDFRSVNRTSLYLPHLLSEEDIFLLLLRLPVKYQTPSSPTSIADGCR